MIRHIVFTGATVAALLAAAPAFASDRARKEPPCDCCSDGSSHEVDHPLREAQKKAAAEGKAQQKTPVETPDINSFGG